MTITPRPDQAKNSGHLAGVIRSHGSGFDGSEPGTGKTITALLTVQKLGLSAVVVCPRVVKSSWLRTAARMGVPLRFVENYEGFSRSKRCTEYGRMEEFEYRKKMKKRYSWTESVEMLIFDEGHYCKSEKSANTELLVAAKRQKIPTLILSATGAESPLDMKALGWHLGLHTFANYWNWLRSNGCSPGTFGGMTFNGDRKALKRIHDRIYPERGVRVLKSDIPGFPETQILPELYDLGDAEQIDKLYAKLQDAHEELKKLKQGDRDRALAKALETAETMGLEADPDVLAGMPDHPLTAQLRARQKMELLKVPLFVQLNKDARENGQHVLVFLNFQRSIDEFIRHCGFEDVSVIKGGQADKPREQNRLDFQSGKNKTIVLNSAAGGVGIDLHDVVGNSPRVSYISPGYRADQMLQIFGRPWRFGALTKSEQRVVLIAGSLETKIHDQMLTKIHNLSVLNDGDLSPLAL